VPELATDERFARNAQRVVNRSVLTPIILERLAGRDLADWCSRLAEAGVPAGPINTIPMALDDAQVRHRQMVVKVPHPVAGEVSLIASPMRFREAPVAYDRHPPLIGEQTEEVLRQLGLGGGNGAP
jgi:crotonobetainyl-CoA:carnitine CoA-transferase CaiB-like acyl-CoA transferase